jgi:hypothetical protein
LLKCSLPLLTYKVLYGRPQSKTCKRAIVAASCLSLLSKDV